MLNKGYVLKTQRTVRDEYLQWDRSYNLNAIATVTEEVASDWLRFAPSEPPTVSDFPRTHGNLDQKADIVVEYYAPDGTVLDISYHQSENTNLTSEKCHHLDPTPPYESCTPSSKSFLVPSTQIIKFIPYADRCPPGDGTPEERNEAELLKFIVGEDEDLEPYSNENFGWVVDHELPELIMVEMEVIRRLYDEGFTLEEIDATKVLMERLWKTHEGPGLLWKASQMPSLPGFGPNSDQVRVLTVNSDLKNMTLLDTVNHEANRFCHNLKCNIMMCSMHCSGSNYTKVDLTKKPRRTSMELIPVPGCPKDFCFKFMDDYDDDMDIGISEDSRSTLDDILQFEPDMSPCESSSILVFSDWFQDQITRYSYIARTSTPTKRSSTSLKWNMAFIRLGIPNFWMEELRRVLKNFMMPGYLHVLTKVFALIQIRNATATKITNIVNGDVDVPLPVSVQIDLLKAAKHTFNFQRHNPLEGLQMHGRECDPEVCKGCEAKLVHAYKFGWGMTKEERQDRKLNKRRCQNVSIQKGLVPVVEIRRCAFGFGAFATSDIKATAIRRVFLGEYAAEIIELGYYDGFANYARGTNYVFDLDDLRCAEAAYLGNETRFLNDNSRYLGTSKRDEEAKDEADETKENLEEETDNNLSKAVAKLTLEDNNNCVAEHKIVNDDILIGLFLVKNVKKDEELFLSYGPKYWAKEIEEPGPSQSIGDQEDEL
ncbi:hypothetical protein C8J56DRAFT_1133908 [Mycena floridula]|nr:hypothetical protein C8J56DRAFT_1133908 [Mycena floridula]